MKWPASLQGRLGLSLGLALTVLWLLAATVTTVIVRGELEEVFDSALQFARAEGLMPAPEPSHAIAAAIDEAIRAREEGKKKVILFNLCGHGLLDMSSYESYLTGKLKDEDV